MRKAIVAGSFYPKTAAQIEEFIKKNIPKETFPQEAKGIVLPHAGYIYSGGVAVETVAKTIPRKNLIIIGPNHTGKGKPFSVYPKGEWETPLGKIIVNSEITSEITNQNLLELDTQAHLYEHSVEVELPILKYFFKEFQIFWRFYNPLHVMIIR